MAQESLWDESLPAEAYQPVELDLSLPRQQLRIRWADGEESVLGLGFLRQNCPCALCRTEREKQRSTPSLLPVLSASQVAAASATCTGGSMVGNYALQLDWSDGHSSGIYDFRLLRSLSPSYEL